MSTVQRTCQRCKASFSARSADVARGWARFCSKSCKAKAQEARTGQHRAHVEHAEHDAAMSAVEAGWDGHKAWL